MAGIKGEYIYDKDGNIIDATGGKKTALTIKQRYGEDFYKRNGAKGGKLGRTGGFWGNRDRAREAGAKGGRRSRRGKAS